MAFVWLPFINTVTTANATGLVVHIAGMGVKKEQKIPVGKPDGKGNLGYAGTDVRITKYGGYFICHGTIL